jgi:hypothetical protein
MAEVLDVATRLSDSADELQDARDETNDVSHEEEDRMYTWRWVSEPLS